MGEIEEPPIPKSYLQRDGLPIVVCQCGKKWCLDNTGERSHIAYAKHWREAHGSDVMGEAKRRTNRLGDAPIEPQYLERMNVLAATLDEYFNGQAKGGDRKTGFVLMVFPFGEEATGRCNYISNGADRKDVVTLMKEMIARFEGQPELSGRA